MLFGISCQLFGWRYHQLSLSYFVIWAEISNFVISTDKTVGELANVSGGLRFVKENK